MKPRFKSQNNEKFGNEDIQIDLSIIPITSLGTPFDEWHQYQDEEAPISHWYNHYMNQGTVGIRTGKDSGNLECLYLEIKNDTEIDGTIIEQFAQLIPYNLYNRLLAQITPQLGCQFIYRCPEAVIPGDMELALNPEKQVLIGTHGEGGYFTTNRINHVFLQGIFDLASLCFEIPVITPEERDLLLEMARHLNRYVPTKEAAGYKER